MSSAPIPIWLDVDTGIDDALALLLACASPEVELVGVSCVAGNVPLKDVVANTLAVLAAAGRTDVPVHAGAAAPLRRPLHTTPETHGPRGLGHATPPESPQVPTSADAPEAIIAAAEAAAGRLSLVTLGPLTNVAMALGRDPDLPTRLADARIMGGTFRTVGNTAPRTEWNVHVDPEALRDVLNVWGRAAERGAVPLPLVMGLDVTEGARLLPEHLAAVRRGAGLRASSGAGVMHGDSGSALLDLVEHALRFYFEFHREYDGFFGAFVHDPFVVASAFMPDLVTAQPTTVDVELHGELTLGETVADWRGHWGRVPNARVATDGDAERFLDELVRRLVALIVARGAVSDPRAPSAG